jgi:hypothetical protein
MDSSFNMRYLEECGYNTTVSETYIVYSERENSFDNCPANC